MPNDPFAYLKIGNTLYEVKDEQARVDLGTLAGVVDGKVPKTTTVNNKALSTDITLVSSDIGYDNTVSGLTATNVKAAIDELDTALDGKVPNTRTVNSKALSSNITLTASDIGYDNSNSGMTATTDQAAIDELDGRVATLEGGGGSGWSITYSAAPDEKLTFTAT